MSKTTTEIFRKHFGENSAVVDLKHPNVEAFFNELNEECLKEDEEKRLILFYCPAKNLKERKLYANPVGNTMLAAVR